MQIVIKKEYLKTKVAFGKNAKPLEERTQEELAEMALLARQSNSLSMVNYFEKLPSLAELQANKTDKSIAIIKSTSTKEKLESTDLGSEAK